MYVFVVPGCSGRFREREGKITISDRSPQAIVNFFT